MSARIDREAWKQAIPASILTTDAEHDRFCKDAILPFVPRMGDLLAVGFRREFCEVEAVFWSEAGGLEIDIGPSTNSPDALIADGWKKDGAP